MQAQKWTKGPVFASDLIKNPLFIKPIADWTDNSLISILTVPFNPDTGDTIMPVNLEDASGNVGNIVLGGTPPTGYAWPLTTTFGALAITNYSLLWNAGGAVFDAQEEATSVSSVVATSASSTQIVAAGGAAKKYKLFAASIAASSIGAATQVNATINEVTSGTVLLGLNISGSAATGENSAVSINFGPNGILQPTANNAIQITAPASVSAYATLVYGAAR